MALDFLMFHRIVELTRKEILNGKITKVSQISSEEILFEIRAKKQNYYMLISTHPLMPYLNLITKKPTSITTSNNLTLLLKKHLENGKIVNISQQNNDRIVLFEIENRDEYYMHSIKKVYVELIGRASNLILTDKDNVIIDCMKKIPVQYNNLRTLLPNMTYELLEKPANYQIPVSIQNELEYRNINLDELTKIVDSSDKIYITESKNKIDFHFFPFLNLEGKITEYNWNEGIETYYQDTLNNERKRQATASLEKVIKSELKRNKVKISKLQQDLQNAMLADIYKYYADLLLTYGQDIKKLSNPTEIFDEENNKTVMIPVDDRRDVFSNANAFYKKYRKAKVAQEKVQEQIDLASNQIDYLNSIQYYLNNATGIALKEIEEELKQQGLIKIKQAPVNKKNKKPVERIYRPLQYFYEGVQISVGENNLQNEYLTFKIAKKNHYYFHVQGFHGAHVIVHSDILTEPLIRMAANLASLHSEANASSSVAVDYTRVKNVKKIPGGKPGKVIISNQKTIYIDPDKSMLKKLS